MFYTRTYETETKYCDRCGYKIYSNESIICRSCWRELEDEIERLKRENEELKVRIAELESEVDEYIYDYSRW